MRWTILKKPNENIIFSSSFGHFATNVCAIVGGIFTVAGIIDSIFHHSIYLIKKKIELGKLS